MNWSENYATGVERIDSQHKMIFKMAEDFRLALDEGEGERVYAVLLESLDRYVRSHFGFEESCMHRAQCPAAQQNSHAHAQFIEVMSGFRERFAARGFDRIEAHGLLDTIEHWLSDHICGIDVQLRPFSRTA